MQDVVTVVSLGSIYLLFALGMSLTWGTIDVLNFAPRLDLHVRDVHRLPVLGRRPSRCWRSSRSASSSAR